jgi:hypothetical protein
MNTLQSTLAAALLALGAALPAESADRSESRDVSNFTGIALSAPIKVELVLGDRDSLLFEGDEAVIGALETAVEDGTLRIRTRPGFSGWNSKWHEKIRTRVTARRIEKLSIAGSGDIVAPELRGEKLAVSIAGSGDVTVNGGKLGELSVSISGSGDVRAAKMETQRVKVSIAGSGDAAVWARDSLTVNVAGSGDVKYYGDPAVTRSIVGSGSVKRLGPAPA